MRFEGQKWVKQILQRILSCLCLEPMFLNLFHATAHLHKQFKNVTYCSLPHKTNLTPSYQEKMANQSGI